MRLLLHYTAVLLLTLPFTHGYSSGLLPSDACMGGPYGHTSWPSGTRIAVQSSPSPFTIQVRHAADGTLATDYAAGEILTVTLSGTNTDQVEGFVLWAREEGQECSTGSWTSGLQQRARACSFIDPNSVCPQQTSENALMHSQRQNAASIDGSFRVPIDFSGTLQFVANVVRDYNTFWTKIVSAAIPPAATTTLAPLPSVTKATKTSSATLASETNAAGTAKNLEKINQITTTQALTLNTTAITDAGLQGLSVNPTTTAIPQGQADTNIVTLSTTSATTDVAATNTSQPGSLLPSAPTSSINQTTNIFEQTTNSTTNASQLRQDNLTIQPVDHSTNGSSNTTSQTPTNFTTFDQTTNVSTNTTIQSPSNITTGTTGQSTNMSSAAITESPINLETGVFNQSQLSNATLRPTGNSTLNTAGQNNISQSFTTLAPTNVTADLLQPTTISIANDTSLQSNATTQSTLSSSNLTTDSIGQAVNESQNNTSQTPSNLTSTGTAETTNSTFNTIQSLSNWTTDAPLTNNSNGLTTQSSANVTMDTPDPATVSILNSTLMSNTTSQSMTNSTVDSLGQRTPPPFNTTTQAASNLTTDVVGMTTNISSTTIAVKLLENTTTDLQQTTEDMLNTTLQPSINFTTGIVSKTTNAPINETSTMVPGQVAGLVNQTTLLPNITAQSESNVTDAFNRTTTNNNSSNREANVVGLSTISVNTTAEPPIMNDTAVHFNQSTHSVSGTDPSTANLTSSNSTKSENNTNLEMPSTNMTTSNLTEATTNTSQLIGNTTTEINSRTMVPVFNTTANTTTTTDVNTNTSSLLATNATTVSVEQPADIFNRTEQTTEAWNTTESTIVDVDGPITEHVSNATAHAQPSTNTTQIFIQTTNASNVSTDTGNVTLTPFDMTTVSFNSTQQLTNNFTSDHGNSSIQVPFDTTSQTPANDTMNTLRSPDAFNTTSQPSNALTNNTENFLQTTEAANFTSDNFPQTTNTANVSTGTSNTTSETFDQTTVSLNSTQQLTNNFTTDHGTLSNTTSQSPPDVFNATSQPSLEVSTDANNATSLPSNGSDHNMVGINNTSQQTLTNTTATKVTTDLTKDNLNTTSVTTMPDQHAGTQTNVSTTLSNATVDFATELPSTPAGVITATITNDTTSFINEQTTTAPTDKETNVTTWPTTNMVSQSTKQITANITGTTPMISVRTNATTIAIDTPTVVANGSEAGVTKATPSAAENVTIALTSIKIDIPTTTKPPKTTRRKTTNPTTTKPTTATTTTTTTTTAKPVEALVDTPKSIEFKLNGDFDALVKPNLQQATAQIRLQLSNIMKVPEERIQDLQLSKGSVAVKFTLAPATDGAVTEKAVDNLKVFLLEPTENLQINGKEMPMVPESLKTTSIKSQKADDVAGLALTTKIVLGVVFGLIGIAIIIAIIVICMRQRKSHGFLMMRAARKDYGIPLRTMEAANGQNGANNGHKGQHNQGFTRA